MAQPGVTRTVHHVADNDDLIEPVTPAPSAARPLILLAAVAATVALVAWSPSRPYALTLLVLLALIALHELGHLLAARSVGVGAPEFSVGFGPVLWRTRRPDRHGTSYALRAYPLGGFVRIDGLGERIEGTSPPVAGKRSYDDVSALKRIWISSAGPLANILVAFVVLAGVFGAVGRSEATLAVNPTPQMAAAAAGVIDGDVLVSIDGVTLVDFEQARTLIAALEPGEEVPVVVSRDGRNEEFVIVPTADPEGRTLLGVSAQLRDVKLGPVRSVTFAATTTGTIVVRTVQSLGGIVDAVASIPAQLAGTEDSPDNRLVSPIGAAQIASDSAEENGLLGPAILVAGVSVFLAVFNMLPVPPLDGGHVAIAAYEGVSSKLRKRRIRVNREKLIPLTVVVISLVLVMGVTSLLLDVVRPI